ncbi:MAG: 1-acyl-sn-glycerol-3-phosphate acyltransferase [Lachnospiraceae bacterium]|jgi:1-acyl-sn-glycerol-3-phosphate acyltransferase|uniref:lysophospholipid acyltransferase family protein n=1 Tax=Parablautia intestinalis TaxID=2320100 RepID=UPI00256F66DF|nr:lysophospholipid acyltransferase family protein [Parablautia intestinalis]MCI8615807.1 1-acyl-sn-glycerol-3-phosphate acyltransferase [Lachnospiraceae bacterium]
MLRFYFVIILSLPFIIFYLCKAGYIEKHTDAYTEKDRYKVAQSAISVLKRNGFIHTDVYGTENLPAEGGYVMYANHQGKYDALGIISGHPTPCTVMIDDKRSHPIVTTQFITLLKGIRLDKSDMREQFKTIMDVIAQVKSGRRVIIFPEGGYYHNRNMVHEFLPGAFKCSIKSKSPIVPVALIDSYKPFELNSLRRVKTQVHFLTPIFYEDYKEMTTKEIADLTRNRIVDAINKVVLP